MKSAILITARLKSTRLPKKVTKLIHRKPMIKHMLDRLKLAKTPSNIIICTSTVTEDDPLEKIAKKEKVLCYRGNADDVLLRLSSAAEKFNIETVINCTADNPFVDPIYIDKLYEHHMNEIFYGFDLYIPPEKVIIYGSLKDVADKKIIAEITSDLVNLNKFLYNF